MAEGDKGWEVSSPETMATLALPPLGTLPCQAEPLLAHSAPAFLHCTTCDIAGTIYTQACLFE